MKQTYKKKRKYSGSVALSSSLNFVTNPIFKKRGFVENKIITDWDLIVGKDLGNCSTPKKISFAKEQKSNGVLHVEVYDSGIAMEMTYMEPVIIEKISVYFGYKAIQKIKIVQRPGGQFKVYEEKKVIERNLSDEKKAILDSYLDEIEDEELKAALNSLGHGVMSDM